MSKINAYLNGPSKSQLTHTIAHRVARYLERQGLLVSDEGNIYLNAVARQLIKRPRKTLDFETPAARFNQCVASTG